MACAGNWFEGGFRRRGGHHLATLYALNGLANRTEDDAIIEARYYQLANFAYEHAENKEDCSHRLTWRKPPNPRLIVRGIAAAESLVALIAFRLIELPVSVLCHADGRAKTFANRAAGASRRLTPRWKRLAIPTSPGIFVRAAETALILTVGRTDETSSNRRSAPNADLTRCLGASHWRGNPWVLRRARLTGGGRLDAPWHSAGGDRTVRRWIGEESHIPYAAWAILCDLAGMGIILAGGMPAGSYPIRLID